MYMILFPERNLSSHHKGVYQGLFTTDMHRVSGALEEPECRVFSLEGLKEVTEIKITYEEVTKETRDD